MLHICLVYECIWYLFFFSFIYQKRWTFLELDSINQRQMHAKQKLTHTHSHCFHFETYFIITRYNNCKDSFLVLLTYNYYVPHITHINNKSKWIEYCSWTVVWMVNHCIDEMDILPVIVDTIEIVPYFAFFSNEIYWM